MSCLFQEGEHGLDEHKLHMYLSALQSLIPSLFALVLQNAPFTSKAKLQGEVPQIEGKLLVSGFFILVCLSKFLSNASFFHPLLCLRYLIITKKL